MVAGTKVVGMVHPAELFKDWSWRTHMIFDLTRAKEESETPDFNLPIRTFIIRPNMAQVVEATDAIARAPKVSVDIETRRNRIACIGLGCSKDWAICIPLERKDGSPYWTEEEEVEVFRIISEIIEDESKVIIMQNHPFDFSFLYQYHLFCRGQIWDTMTMHNLLWPDMRHGLDLLCSFYTREPYYKDEGKLWESWMDEETFWQYNCKDVCVTFEVYERLYDELVQKGLLEFYELHYRHQQPALLATQLTGFRIWERRRARHRTTWTKKIDIAQKALELKFAETMQTKGLIEMNVYSPPTMRWLLYEHLKLPVQRDRKTGEPTTKEDALEKLYVKSRNQTLRDILELRGLRKYVSSYLNVTLDLDERIRCSFGHTDFGRLKATKFLDSTGTNLQTIPEVGRAFFIAD
jgi:DNA polymerase I-like protein with 3'-5' exonuclease and polymerase domains